jgi:hypothetical protein
MLNTGKSTLFTNDSADLVKVEKIYFVNISSGNVHINLSVMNSGRMAHLIPQEFPLYAKSMFELDGPIYLRKGDYLEGQKDGGATVYVSIQGI